MKLTAKHWITVVSSALLMAAIFWLVTRTNGLGAIFETLKRITPADAVIAFLAVIGMQIAAVWRAETICRLDGVPGVNLANLLRLQFVAQFIAHGAPVSALADVAKVAMLSLRFDISPGRALRLTVFERALGAVGAMSAGLLTLALQLWLGVPRGVILVQALVWFAGIGGLVAAAALVSRFKISVNVALLDKIFHSLGMFVDLLRNKRASVVLFLAAVAQLLCMSMAFAVLAHGMDIYLSPLHVIAFMPFIFFVSSLPIFYMGWGGREAAVIFTLGAASSLEVTQAVAISVAFGGVVLLASLPGGAFWLARPSMRKAVTAQARQIEFPRQAGT